MSAVNATPDTQSSASALSSAANFLLSLNAGLGGDNAEAKLFSKFLLQSQTGQTSQPSVQRQSQPQAQTQQTGASTTTAAATDAPKLPSLPALKSLVSAWRHLVERLQGHDSEKTVTAKQKPADNNATADALPASNVTTSTTPDNNGAADATAASAGQTPPASTTADPNTPAATGTSSPAATASTGATDDTDNDSDPSPANDQQTIADILKELQLLALLIERQLQNLQNPVATAASGDTAPTDPSLALDPAQALTDPAAALDPVTGLPVSGTAQDASASQDASGASDPAATAGANDPSKPTLTQALTDLLTLVQLAAKQLQGTQTPADATATDNSVSGTDAQVASASAAPAWPSDAQLKADLKVLLDNLRSSVAAQAPAGPNAAVASGVDVATTAGDASATTDATVKTLPAAAPEATRDAWMQQNDFFNMFKPTVERAFNDRGQANVNFTTASAPNGITADTGGKQGPALDLDLNSQNSATNGNTAANNTLDNSNLVAGANGGSSSTSPYSFASQLSATRAANGGTTGLPDAVEQVILQLNRNVKSGNDQMTLQLNPADLGRVNIKLSFSTDGKVQGTVVADNPATLHLLLKDVRGLERALQEAGLRADPGSLQFSLGDPSRNSSGQTANNYSSGSSFSANDTGGMSDLTTDLSALPADATETYYVTPNRVNLRV